MTTLADIKKTLKPRPDAPFDNVYEYGGGDDWYVQQVIGTETLRVYRRFEFGDRLIESITMSNSNWGWMITPDGTGVSIKGVGQTPERVFHGVEAPANAKV